MIMNFQTRELYYISRARKRPNRPRSSPLSIAQVSNNFESPLNQNQLAIRFLNSNVSFSALIIYTEDEGFFRG